jgi:predicted dehydrogenase
MVIAPKKVPEPQTQKLAKANGRSIGYAIIGLGRISMNHFMPAVRNSVKCHVAAVVSGNREKAEKLAVAYDVPPSSIYDYDNLDAIAKNQDIDAVYIALPNRLHAAYTIRAAKAGKHVLCEKPMATTVEDCQAMTTACKAAGRKLMVAYRLHYEPTNLAAIDMIQQGLLGKIKAIASANGHGIQPGEWRGDKALSGGGPLPDVGIYSLNACRYLTGEEPEALDAYSSVTENAESLKGVEENLSWVMRFPSGVVATCATTYGANMPGTCTVYGEKGWLRLEPAFSYQGLKLTSQIGKDEPHETDFHEKDPLQFQREAEHFADCVTNGTDPLGSPETGTQDVKLITEIYRSCQRA